MCRKGERPLCGDSTEKKENLARPIHGFKGMSKNAQRRTFIFKILPRKGRMCSTRPRSKGRKFDGRFRKKGGRFEGLLDQRISRRGGPQKRRPRFAQASRKSDQGGAANRLSIHDAKGDGGQFVGPREREQPSVKRRKRGA